jgi:hypothetical protein
VVAVLYHLFIRYLLLVVPDYLVGTTSVFGSLYPDDYRSDVVPAVLTSRLTALSEVDIDALL